MATVAIFRGNCHRSWESNVLRAARPMALDVLRPIDAEDDGAAAIFRGIMVSLYEKGKENGHVQAYAPTGAMVLK